MKSCQQREGLQSGPFTGQPDEAIFEQRSKGQGHKVCSEVSGQEKRLHQAGERASGTG